VWDFLHWKKELRQPQSQVIDLWNGNARHGQSIMNGFFFVYDEKQRFFQTSWSDLTQVFKTDDYLATYTCGFSWIRDLKATGDMSARRLTRRMIEFWIENKFSKKAIQGCPIKRSVVAAKRLSSWTLLYDFFGTSAKESFKKIFFSGIQTEYKYVKRNLIKQHRIEDKLIIIKALMEYNVYWDYNHSFFELLIYETISIIESFEKERPQSIAKIFDIFCFFIELRNAIRQWEKSFLMRSNISQNLFNEVFQKIQNYLHKMTAIIRFYRHSNGSLCHLKTEKNNLLFNESISAEKIDTALSQIDDISAEEFVHEDILKFSDKQSVLFMNLEVLEPKNSSLKEYGQNFADNFLNFEWSVDFNNIIHKNSIMMFQKTNFPIFLRNSKLKRERKQILRNFFQKRSVSGFLFNGLLLFEETSSGLYSFSREIKLFTQENLLCGIDTINLPNTTEDTLGLLRFSLGRNLKVVDIKHDSD
jgi:hypothetical protein